MSGLFKRWLQQARDTAVDALHALVDKAAEAATELARDLAKKAIDWVGSAIKSGVDSVTTQLKAALAEETPPAAAEASKASVSSDKDKLLALEAAQLVERMAAQSSTKQTVGFAYPELSRAAQQTSELSPVMAAAAA